MTCFRTMATALAVAACLATAGCGSDKGKGEGAREVVETCEKVGQWCRISGGKVGLCAVDKRGGLTCASQH